MGVPWDHRELEARWQARWETERLYEVDTSGPVERPFYNLVEFPYPSGEGLHVGHALTYCGADVLGRYRRMCGDTVFQPMAFDSFGINAENYALKRGEHPADTIARTTRHFRRGQLDPLGCAWNWRLAVTTSDPRYYRWTQWIFLRLLAAGLAYRAEAPVTWCASCATVLAHEQVEDGRCERCGRPVTERTMTQWFLRITAYADELLDGLEHLNWPKRAKRAQAAWIGRTAGAEVDDAAGAAGAPPVRYRLHDWLISRQRYWGPPIPVVHCPSCGVVPVPEDDLPVLLPEIGSDALRSSVEGSGPLAGVEEWVRTTCPECGGPAERETDVSDVFFDSSWYFLRYPSADVDDRPWDAERTRDWLPVSHYAGGPEHVARHHLYARFVTMALNDMGLIDFREPFPWVRLHGFITRDGVKMGKSKGNVVNPDEYIASNGADALRLALFFCGHWEEGGDWTDSSFTGVERFLSRVWRLGHGPVVPGPAGAAARDTAVKVGAALERMKLNVAIARLMELAGAMARDATAGTAPSYGDLCTLVLALAPLAPYVTEELWAELGRHTPPGQREHHGRSVHLQPWPSGELALPGDVVTHDG